MREPNCCMRMNTRRKSDGKIKDYEKIMFILAIDKYKIKKLKTGEGT